MKNRDFERIYEEAFGFLVTEYDFKVSLSKKESWGYKCLAKNSTTGIKMIDEFREDYLEIYLYRLVDGEIVNNARDAIKTDEPMTGFELGWVIELKNPEAQIKPGYRYEPDSPFFDEKNGRKNYVEFIASRLKEYASDILSGDFSSFEALDTMVKEHWKERNKGK